MNIENPSTAIEPIRLTRERLELVNPVLNPNTLALYMPGFKHFIARHDEPLVHFNKKTVEQKSAYADFDSILVLFSGLTAGGKDTIRNTFKKIHPDWITKPVTATTRLPRERDHEQHGVDYWFYTNNEFLDKLHENEFVETVQQYSGYYGLPKHSLGQAIENAHRGESGPIILSLIEIGAWDTVYQYMQKNYPEIPVLSIFVLPEMEYKTYTRIWLPRFRPDDYELRADRSMFELTLASQADIVLSNPMNPSNPGSEAYKALERHFQKMLTPPSISQSLLKCCAELV